MDDNYYQMLEEGITDEKIKSKNRGDQKKISYVGNEANRRSKSLVLLASTY